MKIGTCCFSAYLCGICELKQKLILKAMIKRKKNIVCISLTMVHRLLISFGIMASILVRHWTFRIQCWSQSWLFKECLFSRLYALIYYPTSLHSVPTNSDLLLQLYNQHYCQNWNITWPIAIKYTKKCLILKFLENE